VRGARSSAAVLLGVALLASAGGCQSSLAREDGGVDFVRGRNEALTDRKIVKRGALRVAVRGVEANAARVQEQFEGAGGRVAGSRSFEGKSLSLHGAVPAARLEATMDAIASLGDVESRSLSTDDVTEEFADTSTRLANDLALRDRLRALLERATDVEDVLAIERELTRLQSEIEARQGRIDRLGKDVEMSSLEVTLVEKPLLGPLGYVGYGLWWAISKLFVIR